MFRHSHSCPNKDAEYFDPSTCARGCDQADIAGIDYDIPGLTDEDHEELVIDDEGNRVLEYPNGEW